MDARPRIFRGEEFMVGFPEYDESGVVGSPIQLTWDEVMNWRTSKSESTVASSIPELVSENSSVEYTPCIGVPLSGCPTPDLIQLDIEDDQVTGTTDALDAIRELYGSDQE